MKVKLPCPVCGAAITKNLDGNVRKHLNARGKACRATKQDFQAASPVKFARLPGTLSVVWEATVPSEGLRVAKIRKTKLTWELESFVPWVDTQTGPFDSLFAEVCWACAENL